MKILISVIVSFLYLPLAFGTSDSNSNVYLVVEHVQSGEFFVQRAPMIACYGKPQAANLAALTKEYKAISNVGCGGKAFYDNINALTCAKVTNSKESADYSSFSEITLDISKCRTKDDAGFISSVKKVVKLNFPQSDRSKEVKLKLIK